MRKEKTESVVYFLNVVLDVCDEIICKIRNGCSEIRIVPVGVQDDESAERINVQGFYADKLFQAVYLAVSSGNNIKIQSDVKRTLDQEIVQVKNPFSELEFLNVNKKHTEALESVISALENSFLEEQYLRPLLDKLQKFMPERKRLQETNLPFLEMSQLTEYTEAYYNVLLVLFKYSDVYSEQEFIVSKEQGSLLDLLLNLDTHDNSGNTKSVSLLSPVALCNVQKMYKLVDSYIKECLEPNMEKNTVLPLFYRDAIVRKTLHAFRWFTSGTGESITHAAIPALPKKVSGNLQISIRSVKEYSSFEGIGELRVAEKIVYEVIRMLQNKKLDEIKIAILGDLDVNQLKRLRAYLYDVLYNLGGTSNFDGYPKEEEEVSKLNGTIPPLTITAFSKNFLTENLENCDKSELDDIIKLIIDTQTNLDDIFFDATNLRNLLDANNVVFMLDCTKLYKPVEIQEERSINIIRMNFSLSGALDYAEGVKDLCSQVRLEELYEMMLVYTQQGSFGNFKKYANDSIIKFFEKYVKERKANNPCTIFAYVSDLPAFNHLYCSDQYYVRLENYNEKEIGIIRFANGKMDNDILDNTGESKVITFNAWQFVKHLCLNSANKITETVLKLVPFSNGDKSNVIRTIDLQRLNFGLDYSDWKNELILFYGVESKVKIGFDQFADWRFKYGKECKPVNEDISFAISFMKVFAEKIILPIFNFKDSVFQDYFTKAVYSFLYGNAKNSNDMLFIHLFRKKRKLLGKVRLLTRKDKLPGDVLEFMNYDYRYSIKRFVELIIQANDTTACASARQLLINQTADSNYSRGGATRIYEQIVKSCNALDYSNSDLCKNCENKRKGVFYV